MNPFGVNPLSANITKWSNTLKQFVGSLQWLVCKSIFYRWNITLNYWLIYKINNLISKCPLHVWRPLLNFFSFLFPQGFLLFSSSLFKFSLSTSSFLHISFMITYQLDFPFFRVLNLVTASILFPSFYLFLVVFWMPWILVTMYMMRDIDKVYCTRYINR